MSDKIPPGYKRTEIGIIPEDWEVKNIEEVSTLKARIGWQGLTTSEYLKHGNYILITGTDFKNGTINWKKVIYVSKKRYNQDKYIQIKKNDILITKDGTIGKVAFIHNMPPKPATLNSGIFVIRPKNKAYEPLFIFHLFNSTYFNKFLNRLMAGSTINHLYQKDFINFWVPLPPIPEQRAIARVLSDFDELIESLDKLIEKKKAIKKGAMQELLTGKKRLQGFSGKWVRRSFDYLFCNIETNKYQIKVTQYAKSGKYPVIDQGKHLIAAFTDDNSKVFNSPEDGVIIFGDHTRIFKFYSKPFVVGADGVKLIYKKVKEVDMLFAYYLLSIISIPETGYNRHFKFLKELEISLPPTLEEQRAIAQILSDMDEEIDTLEKKKEKYKMLKKGAMELLLTGKVRLKDYNFEKGGNSR